MIKINLEKITSLMREVSETEILPHYSKQGIENPEMKKGFIDLEDPVTLADKNSEEKLIARLKDLYPSALFIGEEQDAQNIEGLRDKLNQEDHAVFIIDPLDGTREFVKGGENFYVLVSCVVKGQIIAGFIYHPLSGESLIAEKGAGAYLEGIKLQALSPASLKNATGTIGRRVWNSCPESIDKAKATFRNIDVNPNAGMAALKLLKANTYFGNDSRGEQCHFRVCPYWSTPWDDAPSLIALSEAGGTYSAWGNVPYRLDTIGQGLMMATNTEMLVELTKFFKEFGLGKQREIKTAETKFSI